MNSYICASLLGLVQGLTEFLPVSSSGHLVFLKKYLTVKNVDNLFVDVMLHFGTLLAILIYFRKDILNLIKHFFGQLFTKNSFSEKIKNENFKMSLLIIIGSVPTAAIGLGFKKYFEQLYDKPSLVGIPLIITGVLLFVSSMKVFDKNRKDITFFQSIIVGIVQGLAIIPGISRSGSTIGTGLILGFDRKKAADFSFLLSIPAVVGATILEVRKFLKIPNFDYANVYPVFLGTLVSFATGLIALYIVYKLLSKKKFHYFAYYCVAVGSAIFFMM